MSVWVSDVKRALFLVAWTIVLFFIPYSISGLNNRFDFSAILFEARYDSSAGTLSFQYLPHPSYLLPSLLICIPCFLWLYKMRDMKVPELLGSTGILMVILTLILLLYLPMWAVLPWFFDVVIAIVPDFIDLVPFSGLVFTGMVLLPLLWRVLVYTKSQESTLGKKVAGVVLSVSVLLFPMTQEIINWRSTDLNQNFFEGFSLYSAAWTMYSNVDGNLWGQNSWFRFTISSMYTSLAMIFQILPAIVFAWFVCRYQINRKGTTQVLAAGFVHVLTVTITCVWSNYTGSHPGSWIVLPVPALFIIGFIIFGINHAYQWRRTRKLNETHRVSNEEMLMQLMSRMN